MMFSGLLQDFLVALLQLSSAVRPMMRSPSERLKRFIVENMEPLNEDDGATKFRHLLGTDEIKAVIKVSSMD